MEKKITKKEMFAQVIAMAQGKEVTVTADELVAFATHEIELLEKKANSKSKADTEKAVADSKLMSAIVDHLAETGKALTVSELMTEVAELDGLSNQKVSALMKKLVDADKVVKATDKRKSVFSV
jgi:long-subunit acyl-CoA synthetase (AMP-forming)